MTAYRAVMTGLAAAIMAIMLLLAGMAGASLPATGAHPETATQASISLAAIEPNPTMNGNITWSTFYNGWSPLEYNTSTRNSTLNASLSTYYTNPVSVNASDVQTKALNGTSTVPFSAMQMWHGAGANTTTTTNSITLTNNGSATEAAGIYYQIPITDLPTSNLAYDFITLEGSISGIKLTGQQGQITIYNKTTSQAIQFKNGEATNNYSPGRITTINNGAFYFSIPLSELQNSSSMNLEETVNNVVKIQAEIYQPATSTNDPITLTITGFNITTMPLTLGAVAGTGNYAFTNGSAFLSSFAPNFKWTSITDGGYSVAVSQSIKETNVSISQTAISDGSYIEQLTYQTTGFSLPTAPGLTYGAFNITESMNGIAGSQYTVAVLNGASFITQIQKLKGNQTLNYGSVNPNHSNSLILSLDLTSSQWNSISAPPSFFSIQGIEYYWYVFLGIILGALGLAGAKSGAVSKEESLRGRK